MASCSGDTEPDVPSWECIHLGASNGDFARLVPQSPAARRAFSQVAQRLKAEPDRWGHVRRFIHCEATDVAESATDNSSAAESHTDGSTAAQITQSPRDDSVREYCGYYRLNMTIPPSNQGLGWVLGSSRPDKPDDFVDLLLCLPKNNHRLHSRHCRLRRILDTGVLLAVSDSRKVTKSFHQCDTAVQANRHVRLL
jgi:hypothetical protein